MSEVKMHRGEEGREGCSGSSRTESGLPGETNRGFESPPRPGASPAARIDRGTVEWLRECASWAQAPLDADRHLAAANLCAAVLDGLDALAHAEIDLRDVAAQHEQDAIDTSSEKEKKMCEWIARKHADFAANLRTILSLVRPEPEEGEAE